MNADGNQLISPFDHVLLRERLREAGLLLLACDREGRLINRPPRGKDWLADLFCRSPLFRDALGRAACQWLEQKQPETLEALPGLWLAPTALVERRQISGYSVAVIPAFELLEAEQLHTLCQGAKQDYELCKRLLAQLPPAAPTDVDRLAMMVRFSHDDQTRLTSDSLAMESVGKQLGESYEEISLLYTIIQSMTVVEKPDRFVSIAREELLETLPYAWIGLLFADNTQKLKKLAGRFIFAGELTDSEKTLKEGLRRLLRKTKPDAPIVFDAASDPAHAVYGQTAMIHPVSSDEEVIGLLIAGDKQGEDTAASSVDMKLLGATASHTAIFLENAALYDDLNAMFMGTLEALTSSIDAKDRYTCGHSQRVAHLTQQLAEAIGLNEHAVSRVHIGGLVHDIGKIGVPERVLCKPGKLNDEEYEWIHRHPGIGYRILKDIPQLEDILPGVLHHHERFDGAGYPSKLGGDDIPLTARLITLADSFDAMSSTRTYRARLAREDVLAEIDHCTGAQFDPGLAPIFVRLDFSEFDRLVAEHQAHKAADNASHKAGEVAQ